MTSDSDSTTPAIPDFITAAEPAADKLDTLRTAVARLRDLENEKANLEERLSETNKTINKYVREDLPPLFADAAVRSITLEATGNQPVIDVNLETEYRAVIPKDWPADEKDRAFSWLKKHEGGDLIKTVITVSFDPEDYGAADELLEELQEREFDVTCTMTVHHMTLTSWLKEMWKAKKLQLKDLSIIGGYIGPVVKFKPRKKEK